MLKRDSAQKTAVLTKCQDDWRYYKSLRNQVTSKLRSEKKTWESMKMCSATNDLSSLWKNMKIWLNWNSSGPPTRLVVEGKLLNSPADLANTMNTFFIDKVKNLRSRIPVSSQDPLLTLRKRLNGIQCALTFRSVHPDEVFKVLCSLKNSKSTGIDYIDSQVVKLVAVEILPALTHVIILFIQQQSVGKNNV